MKFGHFLLIILGGFVLAVLFLKGQEQQSASRPLKRVTEPTKPTITEEIDQKARRHYEVFPDGRQTLVIGDVEGCKDFNHRQGDNDRGFQGDCGLVACENILRQRGVNVTENDLVNYAHDHNLCCTWGNPSDCGGTTPRQRADLLRDFGVQADTSVGCTLEGLAARIEEGRGIIASVNAGVLWRDSRSFENGAANHAIVVTGVARDSFTGEIQGFFINDSGPGISGRFVDAATMQMAFVNTGELINSTSSYGMSTEVSTSVARGYQVGDDLYYYTSYGVYGPYDG
jgi:hypothetical protein